MGNKMSSFPVSDKYYFTAFRISRYYNWFLRDVTNKQEEWTDGLNADGCLKRDGLRECVRSYHLRIS